MEVINTQFSDKQIIETDSSQEELTPENRRILCDRIGDEIDIDGSLIDECVKSNTADGLRHFAEVFVRARHEQAVRDGFFTPRTPSDGTKPKSQVNTSTPAQLFAEAMRDAGF